MSGFNVRKAPNVSQYIANLNTIPSPQDLTAQQHDGYNISDDLAIFTNAEFFDFDLGDDNGASNVDYDPAQEDRARRGNAAAKRQSNATNELAFDNGAYQFQDIPFIPPERANLTPSNVQTQFSPVQSQFDLTAFNSPTTAFAIDPQLKAGDKRPYTAGSPSGSPESSSRAAAEEDKRRRNTAASARFRVKKKQREQALEKTAKEMTDRADALEAKIQQLETENKWLRNLVVEKTAKGKDEVAELWKKFIQESNVNGRSKDAAKKEGVGTSSEDAAEA